GGGRWFESNRAYHRLTATHGKDIGYDTANAWSHIVVPTRCRADGSSLSMKGAAPPPFFLSIGGRTPISRLCWRQFMRLRSEIGADSGSDTNFAAVPATIRRTPSE